jgi:hypothetical protein
MFALAAACAVCAAPPGTAGGPGRTAEGVPAQQPAAPQDTTGIIPAGFGSLRQDEISIRVNHLGLTVQAMTMDEDFLRTLAPDSYRALAALRDSKRPQLDSIARRAGLPDVAVWYVTFRNVQQGEAPFSPQDVTLTNVGREFQPLDAVGISSGFAQHRLAQNETAIGLLVFDRAINPNRDLTLRLETQTSGDWQLILQRVERERSLIRARANARGGRGSRSRVNAW